MRILVCLCAAVLLSLSPAIAIAQHQPNDANPEKPIGSSDKPAGNATGNCQTAKADHATSATPPASGPHSGSAPGGAGSTGWTGGTGGSNIGTSQNGPLPGSPNEHPVTARGLDLNGSKTPC